MLIADYFLVRKGGLEPPHLSVPDPKSGASANSATFALCVVKLRLMAAKKNITEDWFSSQKGTENRLKWTGSSESVGASMQLSHAVGCLWLAQEIFADLLLNKAGMFQFEVSALDFAAID